MKILQLAVSDKQYQELEKRARQQQEPIERLVTQVIDEYLKRVARSEILRALYDHIAYKQALWRARKPFVGGEGSARREALRLELIYHSEALEGSPLTRQQMQAAFEKQVA